MVFMAGTRRRRAWVGLALSIAAISRAGRAAEPTRVELAAARELFSRAERDEDAGRWADALEKLKKTGSVKMTPGIRFHIALCEQKLGKLAAALTDYVAADDAAREEGNKDVVDAVLEPLAEVRARVPTITLRPPPGVSDAEISLDGEILASGSLGAPFPVEIGSHAIAARAPNRMPFSATVSVTEKQAVSLDVLLPAAVPLPAPVPAPPPRQTEADTHSRAPRAAAIVTSAGTLALAGFGVGAFLVAGAKQSSAETECRELTSCEGLRGPVRTWDALALAAWVAGAGAGTLAVYLWAHPREPVSPGAALRIGPGSVQIAASF